MTGDHVPAAPGCCLVPACLGLLTGHLVHSLNNLLFGLVGNLDLAAACGGADPEAAGRLGAARDSAALLVARLESIARAASSIGGVGGVEGPVLEVLAAAAGRSVEVSVEWPAWSSGMVPPLLGAGTACLLSVEGSGFVAGSEQDGRFVLRWSGARPAGGGIASGFPSVLLEWSAEAAGREGGALEVESWSGTGGRVSMTWEASR